jgi:hypothetical protein
VGNQKFNPIQLRLVANAPEQNQRVLVVGAPLPAGGCDDPSQLCVRDGNGQWLPAVIDVTSRWGDGSIRWCLVKFEVSSATTETLFLDIAADQQLVQPPPKSKDEANRFEATQSDGLKIVHGKLCYHFIDGAGFPDILCAGVPLYGNNAGYRLTDENGNPADLTFELPTLEHNDCLSAAVVIRGRAGLNGDRSINIDIKYHFYADNRFCMTVGLHNPHRAQHPDGIWDLGDAGSIMFEQFGLELSFNDATEILLQHDGDGDWLSNKAHTSLSLYQASSGGEHWQSPVHVNRHNECRQEFCGYQLELDRNDGHSGARAEPAIIAGRAQQFMSVTPAEFWQNFPKKIDIESASIKFEIFPAVEGDSHELQGGERKQHRFYFSIADNQAQAKIQAAENRNPPYVTVDAGAYEQSQVLGTPVGVAFEPYDQLLKPSFDAQQGFFAKREQQDEFGWRNFGDVVADHETLYHNDDSYFISHYNNQYDCVYGFARQYLLTGDKRWYRLMDELARHVVDIDIYHTDEDRAEYNHGLFWHTDHYQKASTASHRTYSKDHYPQDWTGPRGGGPGPEHCYTSGLKTYYFLTGNQDACDVVIGMTDWIQNYYEGTGTFVEFCKTLLSKDVKKLLASLRGQKVLRYSYPFDRGVGNYIRALLDSYELTGDDLYLDKAEKVIVNTFGAADNIDMRDLRDIEHTWYYTVFLQEVVRFLDTKRERQELTSGFQHARDGLLHYARWMAENEQPYLEQPDKLEYPNDTWAAQEIRKANVLYAAYQYTDTDRQTLLTRARYFRDYVTETLSKSETLYFARIQALLLQNHGPSGLMEVESPAHNGFAQFSPRPLTEKDSLYRVRDFLTAVTSGLSRVIKTTNPKREYEWVRTRLGR